MFCSVEQDSGMAFNIYLSCLIIKLVLLTGQGQPSYEVTVLLRLGHVNLSCLIIKLVLLSGQGRPSYDVTLF